MKTLTLKCPGSCGKTYRITLTDEEYETRQWECPRCGFTAPIKVIDRWSSGHLEVAAPAPAPAAPAAPPISQKTQVHVPITNSQPQATGGVMYFRVEGSGERVAVPLKEGRYLVGRTSSDSTAQGKIAADMYMSREHALLAVSRQDSRWVVQIAPNKATNPVLVNHRPLPYGQAAVLHDGDVVEMGKASVKVML